LKQEDKKMETPRNSRFMMKMKMLSESLMTPRATVCKKTGEYNVPEEYELSL